jgi:hypothetical protein
MKCYKCKKTFESGEGFLEKVKHGSVSFDRYICSFCKEDYEKESEKEQQAVRKASKARFFRNLGALVISNLAIGMVLVLMMMLGGSVDWFVAVAYGLLVYWIFIGLVKSVTKFWRWVFILGSMFFFVYSVMIGELFYMAEYKRLAFLEYLKLLASTPLQSFVLVFVYMPVKSVTLNIYTWYYLILLLTLIGMTHKSLLTMPKSQFKEV